MESSTVSTGNCVPRPDRVKYAILSDVHANLEALRAVLDDADTRADGVLCLGDTVGYGADPEACVAVAWYRSRPVVPPAPRT